MTHWIGIRYGNWIARSHFKTEHQHDQQPLVLIDAKTPFKVRAMNQSAREHNICIGMNLASAEALCSELSSAFFNDKAALTQLEAWGQTWLPLTPHVHLIEPDIILLNVTSSLMLWGGQEQLTKKIVQTCLAQKFIDPVCIVSGFTPLTVRAMLGTMTPAHTPLTQVCTIESAQQLPIEQFPNDDPKIPNKLLQACVTQLKNMGLRTIGDVFRISKVEIATAFSPQFTAYLERFCGDQIDPQPVLPTSHQLMNEQFVEPPAENLPLLLQPITLSLAHLQQQLEQYQLSTQAIVITLIDDHHQTQTFNVGSRQPITQLKKMLELLELQLTRVKFTAPVHTIRIEIPHYSNAPTDIQPLFSQHHLPFAQKNKDRLLDRLQHRLGQKSVKLLQQVEHHTPDLAWRDILDTNSTHSLSSLTHKKLRPTLLYTIPLQISGKKQPFLNGPLELLIGPEKIDVCQWLHVTQRDYFIARAKNQTRYWLYQTGDGTWYIHGLFS